MSGWSACIIPVTVVLIVGFGVLRKVPVLEVFLLGAKEGVHTAVSILPSLLGLLVGVQMLSASGALELFCQWLSPCMEWLGFPTELVPMALLRPISGSGSTALLTQLFAEHGPDGFLGQAASVLSGASETTFYAIAVYFGSVGIQRTRYALPAALAADFACAVFAVLTTHLFGA